MGGITEILKWATQSQWRARTVNATHPHGEAISVPGA
jgi:hypothetical protein